MAKAISQETFDSVVKENIEDFEMTQEEAIADAVKQFEAQGINLSNIVTDMTLQDGGQEGATAVHSVVAAVEKLSIVVKTDPLDEETLVNQCKIIQSECDIDLAHRCLAAKHNTYNLLLDTAKKAKQDNSQSNLHICLQTLCSLCNGQPDLLDFTGTELLLDLLKQHDLPGNVLLSAVKLVRLTCVMHEENRQSYVSHGIIPALVQVLENYQKDAAIVKEVCFALRVLTNDDDMRVPFGKAHEHAKMIVTEANALSKILRICKDYSEDYSVLGELFLTLARLAVRNEFCQEIMELGGLGLMLTALEKSITQQSIVLQALKVMKAIAGNDKVKIAIVKSGGAQLILEAITKHQKNRAVCEVGCSAIATIVLRNPEHCKLVIDANGAEVLVKTMQVHQSSGSVLKQACMAIRNLVARTREYCPAFLELGVEPALQQALATHKELQDEAKAALRDLGCKVELKERWTGEGKGIAY